jgi:hypothetical protein
VESTTSGKTGRYTSATADNTFGNENLILSLFLLSHFQKSFLFMH